MHEARAAVRRDPATSNTFEGEHCRVERSAQLVRENGQTLLARIGNTALALTSVLRHRFRDGIVEAEIERLELGPGNGRVLLHDKLGNGLTDVSVVVDDLANGEPHPQKVRTSAARALADRLVIDTVSGLCQAQRNLELIQKFRDPVSELDPGRRWTIPGTDSRPCAGDDDVAIR